jgi:UDP-N-acetylmuramoyl-tripeptide--D-alanyl-D-alanine ligase
MLTVTADKLARAIGGRLVSGSSAVRVTGIAIDSRAVEPGDAFVALPGEHHDGHDFVLDVLSRGASALLITRPVDEVEGLCEAAMSVGAAVVEVPDALTALQDLASWQRDRLGAVVVGVTGSTGKTTTKDMLTSVLARRRRTVATTGNRNNELGAPLTILEADADTEVLVVEMAMRGLGQIARLAEITRPMIGLVTNVGQSHIEVVGSEDAIAEAKGELVAAIPPNGVVVLNADDARTSELVVRAQARVSRYGMAPDADVRAENVTLDEMSHPSFELVIGDRHVPVTLPLPGRHNVYNALAAAAVALELCIGLEDIAEGLSAATVTDMRMQTFVTASGTTVVNDAYNANPTSMRAAVDTLAAMTADGRRIAVLGDMAELGSYTDLAHFRIGEHVARSGVEALVTVGERATRIAEGARAAGMPAARIVALPSVEAAKDALPTSVGCGDIVLVKASRVMGLERLVDGLVSPDVH